MNTINSFGKGNLCTFDIRAAVLLFQTRFRTFLCPFCSFNIYFFTTFYGICQNAHFIIRKL